MTYLVLFKFWREILIGILAFLLIICLGLLNNKVGQLKQAESKYQAYIDNQEKLLAQAQADAYAKEKQWSEKLLKAEQNYNVQIKQITADADLAKSNADSLSKQLDTAKSRVPTATTQTIVEYIDTSSDLFKSCITEYRTMAKVADEHAADAKRLIDAWPVN